MALVEVSLTEDSMEIVFGKVHNALDDCHVRGRRCMKKGGDGQMDMNGHVLEPLVVRLFYMHVRRA